MNKTSETIELAGKQLTLETGDLAKLATSSILARCGDTMILATVVAGQERTDIDYFPLSVEYVERLYAGGRIKGSRWVKREGRPSDDSILTGRLIDRSIRPLFPKNFKKEVQVVVTVLSVDGENDPDTLSIIAVSAALSISPIPWNGPVSAVRVGLVNEEGNGGEEHIINPGSADMEFADLDIVVTQTNEKTLMLEAGANQVSDEKVLTAIEKAHAENKKVIQLIEKMSKKIGAPKEKVAEATLVNEAIALLEKSYKEEVLSLIKSRVEKESSRDQGSSSLIEKVYEDEKARNPETEIDKKIIAKALESFLFKTIRKNILEKGQRPDGRGMDEIRSLSAKVSVLPRTHGSAIFQRGDTQVLTVATLGSPRLEQLIESAEGEEVKRYIHHYSFPPYSVGEAGRIGTPSRREIGHGALAERALEAVIPSSEEFPYTIRMVSEVLASNGSTSMASTCGSTLALMDAGVPIKEPVAGIAMGLMTSETKYQILTDILGLEDFSGDMDFKVAGTKNGITAIQLDVKIPGLTLEQIKETFERAKEARLKILDVIIATIPNYREEVSEYAPKIEVLHIPVDKIGEVIGPGGRVIKNIIAKTGATVDVEDDGTVAISSQNDEAVKLAVEWVGGLTRELKVGEEFEGEVKRILPFGAFVEVLPGKEGMVHVSHMSKDFVNNPADVVEIGQKVKVRVSEIDQQGRVNLSMLFGADAEAKERGEGGQGHSGGPPRGGTPAGRGPSGGRGGYAATQRPYGPRSFGSDQSATSRTEHPLSRQLRREGQEDFRRNDHGPRKPFKKTHY